MRTRADNPWPAALLTVAFVLPLLLINGCSDRTDRREPRVQGTAKGTPK